MTNDNDDLNGPITESEVSLCMKKIKNGKSTGLGDTYPEFAKYATDEFINMVTYNIFQ